MSRQRVLELTGGSGADIVIDMDLRRRRQLSRSGALASHGTHVATVECAGDNAIFRPDRPLHHDEFFIVYELNADVRRAAIADLRCVDRRGSLTHTIGADFRLTTSPPRIEAVDGGPHRQWLVNIA